MVKSIAFCIFANKPNSMKKLMLALQGYKQIDEMEGEWSHIYVDINGEDVCLLDYATYQIFYNARKDKYKMLIKGFKPFHHFLYTELISIIDFLNLKPVESQFKFFHSYNDYFVQRNILLKAIEGELTIEFNNVSEASTKINIMRLKLTNYKEVLDTIKSEDPKLIQKMQEYKKQVLLKTTGLDIWQDIGNVIITSEGCYYSVYNEEKKNEE